MKEYIRKLLYSLFSVINIFVPKQNRVFIYGGSELSGNSEAILKYLLLNTNIPIICIADKRAYELNTTDQVVFIKNNLWNAFCACIRSRIVLESSLHTIKMKPCINQLFLQMWHGSPLKKLSESGLVKNGDYYTYIIYASELFIGEMKRSFKVQDGKMLLIGNPRNDDLFDDSKLPEMFRFEGKSVLWMPTFRRGIGLQDSSKDIPVINSNNIQELEKQLRKLNIKIYIKPHPLQIGGLSELFAENHLEYVRLLTDEELRQNNISVYSFLGKMDALLTDYSSVYFDYLLVNKPIGFVIDDFDEYKKNRGFALEPPEKYMPGQRISSINDLLSFFEDLNAGKDSFILERKRINDLANYYQDNNNCQRCVELIKKYLEK